MILNSNMQQFRVTGSSASKFGAAVIAQNSAFNDRSGLIRDVVKRISTLTGSKHKFQAMAGGFHGHWIGFAPGDAAHAPSFLKKNGWPRLNTKDGKWLAAQIKMASAAMDVDPLDCVDVASVWFIGATMYSVGWFQHDGHYYIHNIPRDAHDRVGGVRSDMHPDLVEVPFQEWVGIITDFEQGLAS